MGPAILVKASCSPFILYTMICQLTFNPPPPPVLFKPPISSSPSFKKLIVAYLATKQRPPPFGFAFVASD